MLVLLLLLGARAEAAAVVAVAAPVAEPWFQLVAGGRGRGRDGEREGVWARLPRFGGRLGLVFS